MLLRTGNVARVGYRTSWVMMLCALFGAGVSSPAQAQHAPPPPETPKPNIVFILMDNLGYGEVGCYGGGELRGAPTPRIDRLASEGMRLTNYNVEAQCTPTGKK